MEDIVKERLRINVVQAETAKDLSLPNYATLGSSGMDICANIEGSLILKKGERIVL